MQILKGKLQAYGFIGFSCIVCAAHFGVPADCLSETVALPLTIDYQLLRSQVIYSAFTGPNETATVLDEGDGCNRIIISDPTFSEENSQVRCETQVQISLGTPLGDNCLIPIEWKGYLVLLQRPRINPNNWTLSFDTVDSILYNRDHQPAKVEAIVWKLVKGQVYDYLNGIRINLAPPLKELKSFLRQLFLPEFYERTMKMLESIRPGDVSANPDAVRVDVLVDVEEIYEKRGKQQKELISEEELKRFIDIWEAWDTFLVHMMTSLANEPLSEEDRQILLDTLLETRHRFVAGLTDKTIERDFVREQFIAAWQNLSSVFRNHLGDKPQKNLLGYLAFFTAADALIALDMLGPGLGIEISRNGLIRLARLLAEGGADFLAYHTGVDSQLREVLGLGPPPAASGPAFDTDELEFDSEDGPSSRIDKKSLSNAMGSFFCQPAWAQKKKSAVTLTEIRTWLVTKKNLNSYVARIRSLLQDAGADTLRKRKTFSDYNKLFPSVVLSTAWQESCLRQFLIKNRKIVYLRSYNGSSVGLMQVNERVWRGMYDLHHLRWNIRYNATAGCEIIDLYVTKYVARKSKELRDLKDDTLAGVIYAMYNGGPGQLDKFLRRRAKGKFYLSDKLFLEKFIWVKNEQLKNIRKCFFGG